MTHDDIIKMAIEARLPHYWESGDEIVYIDRVTHFAKLVAQHEREACVALRQQLHPRNYGGQQTYDVQDLLGHMNRGLDDYADMIRARGTK